jgi:hypothetical protein
LLPGAEQLSHRLCFSQQQTEVLRQQVDGGGQLIEHIGPVVQLIGIVNTALAKIKIGSCTTQKSELTQPRCP